MICLCLVDVSISEFAKSLASKLYGFVEFIVKIVLHGLASDGLAAYALRQEASFHAHGVLAVFDVTGFFGPTAHNVVSTVPCRILATFKG